MVAMQSPKVVASTTADVRDRILNRFQTVVKPLLELLKRPGTAVLVVAGLGALAFFVSFTVQSMLGMNDAAEGFTASSIVTPMG